jgi:hypothetical protein
MPALMPAEVQIGPSLMKIRSSSIFTLGNLRCSSRAWSQWVVTRRPSSSPASARTNAPVHTAATRRQWSSAPPMNLSIWGVDGSGTVAPPTNNVSKGVSPNGSLYSVSPDDVRMGPPLGNKPNIVDLFVLDAIGDLEHGHDGQGYDRITGVNDEAEAVHDHSMRMS